MLLDSLLQLCLWRNLILCIGNVFVSLSLSLCFETVFFHFFGLFCVCVCVCVCVLCE